ncbi:hypothetical protein MAP00_001878 [Monascus purpureus]|nr:hypothetical protein MAP00_001878 [Monascus purpureus]
MVQAFIFYLSIVYILFDSSSHDGRSWGDEFTIGSVFSQGFYFFKKHSLFTPVRILRILPFYNKDFFIVYHLYLSFVPFLSGTIFPGQALVVQPIERPLDTGAPSQVYIFCYFSFCTDYIPLFLLTSRQALGEMSAVL